MTTVVDEARDRPQLHALVVGVNQYPYCGATTEHRGTLREIARRIEPLSCAAPSAIAVAQWLLGHQGDDETAPLGSLELLVSSTPPVRFDAGDGLEAIEPATFSAARSAFARWYDRCDRRPDNVAFLFFCGHGLRMRDEDVLLLEDVGDSAHTFFENAVQFSETYRAIRQQCRARVQCYFIDACRTVPEPMIGTVHVGARALKQSVPRLGLPPVDAPIVYSTGPEQPAFGADSHPTPYTLAVLQALDGLAAAPGSYPATWEVRTDRLVPGIRELLSWNSWPETPSQAVSWGGDAHGGLLRVVKRDPVVPFRIGCEPREALTSAHLRLVDGETELVRPPAPTLWHGSAPASQYHMYAEFNGCGYQDAESSFILIPPPHPFDLVVQRP